MALPVGAAPESEAKGAGGGAAAAKQEEQESPNNGRPPKKPRREKSELQLSFEKAKLLGTQFKSLIEQGRTIIEMASKDEVVDGQLNPWGSFRGDCPALQSIMDSSAPVLTSFNTNVAFTTCFKLSKTRGSDAEAITFLTAMAAELNDGHANLLQTVGPIMASQAARMAFVPKSAGTRRQS